MEQQFNSQDLNSFVLLAVGAKVDVFLFLKELQAYRTI